jgi:HSP20 family protein
MDNSDKQFFAELVGAASGAEETYDVELAKASSGVTAARAKHAEETHIARHDGEMETTAGENGSPEGSLIVDVFQTPDEFVVQSAIAGVKPEDIDINATPDKLTIRGARHHDKEVADEHYLCQECYWGRFSREIIFPQEVDPESATVSFKNGILTVRLPKTSKKKTKKLHVKSE